ncbi:MAG TPA: hypothetical protein VKV96_02670, partial [Roseiarcus sp.]|nr:hypothetical protein [Roseiarcus sp.]
TSLSASIEIGSFEFEPGRIAEALADFDAAIAGAAIGVDTIAAKANKASRIESQRRAAGRSRDDTPLSFPRKPESREPPRVKDKPY